MLLHVPLGTHVQSVEPVLMQPDVITQWYRQAAQIAPNRVLQAVQLLVECAEVLFSWVQHASVLVSAQRSSAAPAPAVQCYAEGLGVLDHWVSNTPPPAQTAVADMPLLEECQQVLRREQQGLLGQMLILPTGWLRQQRGSANTSTLQASCDLGGVSGG